MKTLIRNSLEPKCHTRKRYTILEHNDTRTQRKPTANRYSLTLAEGIPPQRYKYQDFNGMAEN